MVCREAQVGSAVTSFVIQTTGLEERQVLSLYHEVMRDGRNAPAPTAEQQAAVLAALEESISADTSLTEARRRSILDRIGRAADEEMNGQRYYSTTRLLERAQRAEEAMDDYVAATARDLGITESQARDRFHQLRQAAAADRTLRAPRDWVNATREDPTHSGLPLDPQTAYAIRTLNDARQTHLAAQPTRRTVTRHPQPNSRAIAEMGYDQITGRVEVVLRSNPDVVYAYRMTPEQWNAFASARSVGSYYAREVRGNDRYRYADATSAREAGTQTQCPTCGQFAGAGHACPPRDSVEERNRTARRARRAAQPSARNSARRATPLTHADEQAQHEDDESLRLDGSRRRYHGDSGSFRTVALTDVQQNARRNTAGVTIPVTASISRIAGENGEVLGLGAISTVSGSMQVTYNGRGRGYTAVACTNPGDTGRDQLRCTCADYRRNYDCVHVRQAVQDMNTRLNADALRTRHGIGPAIEQVNADLAQDRAESIAAQETSRETWTESPVSYTDDPEAFQRDYRAAKRRARNGEQVVPYMTENATGGLGARGTGRAFGVELEFDIEPGVDRYTALRNIGRALHEAGLTRSAAQRSYHSSSRGGYTENHRGGWSFEADSTVAGEIVSPIMYDTPETWENLDKVCQIIRENGGIASIKTGSHVHVSAHNYDHTVENHNRLLASFAENEDLIYRLSANPERGSHRGPRWCSPNQVPSAGYASVAGARDNNVRYGLNLGSVNGAQSDHVEFRTYDGSIDPSVIQTQIKMSLAMTEAAFRDTTYQPGTHTPLGAHRSHNRATYGASRRLTGEAWQQDTAGYRAFADRLFHRPEDKAQLTALFAATRWQRGARR